MPASDFSAPLAELKDMVLYEPEFIKTFTYFFDNLSDHEEFLSSKVSHSAKNEVLAQIIRFALEQYFGKRQLKISDVRMLRVRGTPFYHGSFTAERQVCGFIYFEDIARGILAVTRIGDPMSHFMRITATPVATGPVWN